MCFLNAKLFALGGLLGNEWSMEFILVSLVLKWLSETSVLFLHLCVNS